jgi:hypothetical protein
VPAIHGLPSPTDAKLSNAKISSSYGLPKPRSTKLQHFYWKFDELTMPLTDSFNGAQFDSFTGIARPGMPAIKKDGLGKSAGGGTYNADNRLIASNITSNRMQDKKNYGMAFLMQVYWDWGYQVCIAGIMINVAGPSLFNNAYWFGDQWSLSPANRHFIAFKVTDGTTLTWWTDNNKGSFGITPTYISGNTSYIGSTQTQNDTECVDELHFWSGVVSDTTIENIKAEIY